MRNFATADIGNEIALDYMYYNFVRIHKSLRCTPAMAAGVTNRLWEIEDMINLLPEPVAKERGPYKKEFQTDPLPLPRES